MIKNIFKIILFTLYSLLISIGLVYIDMVGLIPTPDDFISIKPLSDLLLTIEFFVFLFLWILMICVAYKRVFKSKS